MAASALQMADLHDFGTRLCKASCCCPCIEPTQSPVSAQNQTRPCLVTLDTVRRQTISKLQHKCSYISFLSEQALGMLHSHVHDITAKHVRYLSCSEKQPAEVPNAK